MVELKKPEFRPVRRPLPTGEKFDPAVTFKQPVKLYPNLMAKLAA